MLTPCDVSHPRGLVARRRGCTSRSTRCGSASRPRAPSCPSGSTRSSTALAGHPLHEAVPHDDELLELVHDGDLLAFLEGAAAAWAAAPYEEIVGQDRVVPYFFPTAGLLAGMEPTPGRPRCTPRPGEHCYDTMTLVGPGTWEAARAAVDVALTAVDLVRRASAAAYALCRPPGHHVTPSGYGGSCYLNNAAVAAEALRGAGHAKVAVVDIDAHHGNGTQAVFWERADVLYGSLHVDPAAGWFPHVFGHAVGDRCRRRGGDDPQPPAARGHRRRAMGRGGRRPRAVGLRRGLRRPWSSRSASTPRATTRRARCRSPPTGSGRRAGPSAALDLPARAGPGGGLRSRDDGWPGRGLPRRSPSRARGDLIDALAVPAVPGCGDRRPGGPDHRLRGLRPALRPRDAAGAHRHRDRPRAGRPSPASSCAPRPARPTFRGEHAPAAARARGRARARSPPTAGQLPATRSSATPRPSRPLPAGAQDPPGRSPGATASATTSPSSTAPAPATPATSRSARPTPRSSATTSARPSGSRGGRVRRPRRLTVTGVYEQVPGDYWFGLVLTGYSGVTDPVTGVKAARRLAHRRAPPSTRPTCPSCPRPTSTVDLPLDADAVGVDELLALADDIDRPRGHDQARRRTPGVELHVFSGLPDIAQDVRDQTDQSRVTVPLLMAQLGPARGRRAVAGAPRRHRAAPARGRARPAARPGPARRPRTAARRAAAGRAGRRGPGRGRSRVLGSWFARTVLLPGRRAVRAPAAGRWPPVARRRRPGRGHRGRRRPGRPRAGRAPCCAGSRRDSPGWGLGVADAMVIAGAGALVVVFATGGLDGPIALAAPGLLAIVVGLVLAHLTTPTAADRRAPAAAPRPGPGRASASSTPRAARPPAGSSPSSPSPPRSRSSPPTRCVVGDRNRASAAEQEAGAAGRRRGRRQRPRRGARRARRGRPGRAPRSPPWSGCGPPATGASTLAVVPDAFRPIALFPGGAPSGVGLGRARGARRRSRSSSPAPQLDRRRRRTPRSTSRAGRRRVQPGDARRSTWSGSGETLHTTARPPRDARPTTSCPSRVSCTDGLLRHRRSGSAPCRARIDRTGPLAPAPQPSGDAGADSARPTSGSTYRDPARPGIFRAGRRPARPARHRRGHGAPRAVTVPQVWLPGVVPGAGGRPARRTTSPATRSTVVGLDGEASGRAVRSAPWTGSRPPGPTPTSSTSTWSSAAAACSSLADIEVWFADDDPALLRPSDRRPRRARHRRLRRHDPGRRARDVRRRPWPPGACSSPALVGAVSLLIALLVLRRERGQRLAVPHPRPRRAADERRAAAARSGRWRSPRQLPAVLLGVVAGSVCGLSRRPARAADRAAVRHRARRSPRSTSTRPGAAVAAAAVLAAGGARRSARA